MFFTQSGAFLPLFMNDPHDPLLTCSPAKTAHIICPRGPLLLPLMPWRKLKQEALTRHATWGWAERLGFPSGL